MPTVDLTHTEINPTYTFLGGGGTRDFTHTEINPSFLGGAGGGWKIFTATERSPDWKLPSDTQTMGRTKGLDFRGKGFRI